MPQELPGFYYDKEKNRYFPLKGPIPGSSRSSSSTNKAKKSSTNNTQASNFFRRTGVRISQLLQSRELNGNVITSSKGKCDFVEEFLKLQASQPVVLKYQSTEKIADSAMDQIHIDIHTAEGQTEAEVLLTGSVNGSLSLFEVGKVGEHNHGVEFIPDRMRPAIEENRAECGKDPGCIWRPPGASLHMSSNISCIKMCGKHSPFQRALITTLGSETSGGSVYILNLVEPVDFDSSSALAEMMRKTAAFNCTIWTADCSYNSNRAVIGTNIGAALVNLETGMTSWVCRSKSDVLSQQLDPSGNVVLCGLRNGAILTVDVREKQERVSDRLIRHRIPYSSLGRQGPSSSKQWFEVKGNIYPSRTIFMPSSICSLVMLQSYDQYFLASSMDGLIKLYDQRMTKRGGEDCNLRLWSIKSGKLLYEEKISDSVLSTVCWKRSERLVKTLNEGKSYEKCLSRQNHSWGTWFGSPEGLFYISWS
ncbi:TRANSDUCIN/WD40 REPEAT-LIKE SUPERFAMILY PROTEIN [Salix viminalis]|uniref:TRANSDUCIN/WD40 REPEAT-LIKE SUPERFAMILY PROTEIN n=1 Tax=Salix viminalis TaxID=40686 RepID=A0A9Q0TKV6_SALVM|nr:TRANSDUCIN/WD40 REPEAT-LIKE SUPERFAMILY PROTEIN [Salix viminalis]